MSDDAPEPIESGEPTPDPAAPDEASQPDEGYQPSEAYQAAGNVSGFGYIFFAGCLLALTGGVWRYVEGENTLVLQIWLFVALVALLSPLFWHAADLIENVASKRGLAGLFVAVTTVLGIGAFGLVSWANINYELPVIDLTSSDKFTLGDESEKLIDQIEGTVYATYLRQGYGSPIRGEAESQLKVFGSISPKIEVRVFDALRDGAAATEYLAAVGVVATSSGETDDVIVFSHAEPGLRPTPGKQKELRVEQFTWTKRSAMGETKWGGERMIAEAIHELLFEQYEVHLTGGHGERSMTQEMREFRDALQGQNIVVAENPVDLRMGAGVPAECDILMILDPQSPFSAEEEQAVRDFLNRGKAVFLSLDVAESRRELGLETLLAEYGMKAMPNYKVVAPAITGWSADGSPQIGMHTTLQIGVDLYADHPATSALRARLGRGTAFVDSTPIEVLENVDERITAEPVVIAPESPAHRLMAFAARMPRNTPGAIVYDKDVDLQQPRLPIVVCATRELGTGLRDGPTEGRLVLLGDTDVITDRLIQQIPTNVDLAMGLAQWGLRREGLIAVSDRTIEAEVVSLDAKRARVALGWPLGAALLSLIVGGVVWWSRRR